ncbi:hypothetical protein HH214_00920 [Mucilaginibacter robiniae]|uniref:Virulence factor n=1 Tax=Mucilaginibacter robiniae TaxID=2728022 RepID=A0A7L5E131_9SPHI|nr:hypothetical protein [Mucilaginibacter robiniae]QJD94533.1 hypothetical protein HH214_00920 [Mucilaginibacter robiniae]
MKRITFLAVLVVALFTINSAKAQVGVHVGLNFGTPYYYHPHYYRPQPVIVAPPAPVVYNEYGYYARPAAPVYYRHAYYARHFYRPRMVYRRW